MKFRSKYIEGVGYFAQVQFQHNHWGTIGKHPVGYGLYPADHVGYPLFTIEEVKARCEDYRKWAMNKEGKVAVYEPIKI